MPSALRPTRRFSSLLLALGLAPLALVGCVAGGGGGGGGEPTTDGGPDPDAAPMCRPDCADRACGPDGCGGVCGECPDDEVCAEGACAPVPASCGDGACGEGETCENCAADCGECCGDGVCNADQRETCVTCAADCACAEGETCDMAANACVADCTPDCAGRACGADGCGGECGACEGDLRCDADGQCVAAPDACGDGACGEGEDCSNCLDDCPCADGQACERGVCAADCPDDCGPLWQASCTADGFGYRLCAPDPERPGCTAPSRRILCGEGRDCVAGDGGDRCAGRCQRPEVLVLVDRSSSMEGARWQFTRAALVDMSATVADFVRLGLRMFPGEEDGCAAGPLAAPAFDATAAFEAMPAPAQVAQTPIASALDGAADAFGDPDEGESVILVTDGDETCAGEFDAVSTAAALRLRGVRTFVIGIGREANGDLLTAIAEAGGTAAIGPAPYQAVQDGPELRAALDAIFGWLEIGRAERCDGDDDDCDGVVDEDVVAPPAERQGGVCGGAVQVCDGQWSEPDYAAIEGYEADEATCDGRDNDCDDRIDEGLEAPDAGRQDGVCRGALQVCAEGWIEPDYARIEGYESPEASCDGLDNDCDGALDEALDAPLAEVQAGICDGAVMICLDGWVEPDYAGLPDHEAPEASCDGLDNDCDGRIDEQLDPPLADRQLGVCAGAVRECAGRWIEPDYRRVADYESPEATCEGLDNDCDGRVDEDVECPVICGAGELGPPCNRCPAGTVVPPGMVCVPAGLYTRGSPPDEEGRGADEAQVETRIERAFLIQATEVTRAQWTTLVDDDPAARTPCVDNAPDRALDCPLNRVTWWEAAAYANALSDAAALTRCYALANCDGALGQGMQCDLDVAFDPECTGYRLPTEEEWEYAARAGTATRFWSGDAVADLAAVDRFDLNAQGHAHPVAGLPPNPWGLFDVHGNVREWCNDWRVRDFTRDLRGGSFDDRADLCRAARRHDFRPDNRSRNVGFRLVRTLVDTPCGDGVCDPRIGESCASCPVDCGCAPGTACIEAQCVACAPECGGRVCGSDGCGGTCGRCDDGDACVDGACRLAGLELEVDDGTPIPPEGDLRVIALAPPGLENGRIEDVHGRAIALFEPTADPLRDRAFVTWAALNAVEPLEGQRRERRALYAVYDLDGEPVRLPFTARILCPLTEICLGTCIARGQVCDRACADCQGDQICLDRQCIDPVDGVALVGLVPRVTGVVLGESVPRATKGAPLQVQLDRPAPPGGVVVQLESFDPAIVVPAEVVVPAGADRVAVEVQTLGRTHGAGIVARLGGQARYGEIRTVEAPDPAPRLIINEVDYDQPGQDMAEFVELYNPTDAVQPLDDLALVFVNGDDDGDPYLIVPLGELPPLLPGELALVGDDLGVAVPRLPLDGEVQGGDSDGVLIVDTVSGAVVDAFAYDGYLLGVTEGGAQDRDLRTDREESFARCPNGVDGNDNGVDFVQTAPSPGLPNACP